MKTRDKQLADQMIPWIKKYIRYVFDLCNNDYLTASFIKDVINFTAQNKIWCQIDDLSQLVVISRILQDLEAEGQIEQNAFFTSLGFMDEIVSPVDSVSTWSYRLIS
jgi:hypothetical protein